MTPPRSQWVCLGGGNRTQDLGLPYAVFAVKPGCLVEQTHNRRIEVWPGVNPQTADALLMLLRLPAAWSKERKDLGSCLCPFWIWVPGHSAPSLASSPFVRKMPGDISQSEM